MRLPLLPFLCVLSFALPVAQGFASHLTDEESLLIKRITEFWKDKDYNTTKSLIKDFLLTQKESQMGDKLYAMLGDLHFKEGSYSDAIEAYAHIVKNEHKNRIITSYLRSFFELKEYDTLIELADSWKKASLDLPEDAKQLLAEALFCKLQTVQNPTEKLALAERAKELYCSLKTQKESAAFALAEIHKTLGEAESASEIYLQLSKNSGEKKEDLLFQVAKLQYLFDRNKAAQTLEQISQLGGEKKGVAAYQRLLLLFQGEQYKELIASFDHFKTSLEKEKLPLLNYYAGRSYFLLEEYDKAKELLLLFTQEQKTATPQLKSALLTLLSCAQKESNFELFDLQKNRFQTEFPKDKELPNVLFVHANFCTQNGKLQQAQDDLQFIIQNFPDHENRGALIYDYGILLYQNKNFAKSREVLLGFVDQFPTNTKVAKAFSQVLNCSIQELNEASCETAFAKREKLASDLETALSKTELLEAKERLQYRLMLAKTLYDVQRFSQAKKEFQIYLDSHPKTENNSELATAHLLIGLCALQGNPTLADHQFFVSNTLQALEEDPSYLCDEKIHLQLYNSYLALAKSANRAEAATFLASGASHLFTSFELNKESIQQENLSWLAGHYLQQVKEGHNEHVEKVEKLYSYLLKKDPSNNYLVVTEKTLFLETDAIDYASYLEKKSLAEKIALLEALKTAQDKSPSLGWKYVSHVAFELASSYEKIGNTKQACLAYSELIALSAHTPTYYTHAAQLKRARLIFAELLQEGQLVANNQVTDILNCLKDLQIKKSLLSEPLHLEAALEYANIRIALSKPEDRTERALFFLGRIKEDYLSQEDPIAKEYFIARTHNPEKDKIYQNYMKFIDAEMKRLEAVEERAAANLEKADSIENEALLLFNELLADSKEITPYLQECTKKSLEKMHQL